MSIKDAHEELLIVSLTPQNLERGNLWFKENLDSIKKARLANPWWRENSLFIEKDLVIKPSELVRHLIGLGYERSQSVLGRGIFAVRGGIVEVWPINTEKSYLVEFRGNVIAEIKEREEHPIEVRLPFYRSRTSIDKLPVNSYVVHVDHGIGIFKGAATGNTDSMFFLIEYAPPAPGREPDKLYVPTDQKNRL